MYQIQSTFGFVSLDKHIHTHTNILPRQKFQTSLLVIYADFNNNNIISAIIKGHLMENLIILNSCP